MLTSFHHLLPPKQLASVVLVFLCMIRCTCQHVDRIVRLQGGCNYASSSFLILRSGGSVLRSLLPPLLLDDGGSVLTVGLEGKVEGGGGGGKSDG